MMNNINEHLLNLEHNYVIDYVINLTSKMKHLFMSLLLCYLTMTNALKTALD